MHWFDSSTVWAFDVPLPALYFSPLRLPTRRHCDRWPGARASHYDENNHRVSNDCVVHSTWVGPLHVAAPAIARDQCPLRWWAANVTSYPLVAKVAWRLLEIPATSVADERLFSKAGDVIKSRFLFFSIPGKILIFDFEYENRPSLPIWSHHFFNALQSDHRCEPNTVHIYSTIDITINSLSENNEIHRLLYMKGVQTTDTSDPRHFSTGAKVSIGHFSTSNTSYSTKKCLANGIAACIRSFLHWNRPL